MYSKKGLNSIPSIKKVPFKNDTESFDVFRNGTGDLCRFLEGRGQHYKLASFFKFFNPFFCVQLKKLEA